MAFGSPRRSPPPPSPPRVIFGRLPGVGVLFGRLPGVGGRPAGVGRGLDPSCHRALGELKSGASFGHFGGSGGPRKKIKGKSFLFGTFWPTTRSQAPKNRVPMRAQSRPRNWSNPSPPDPSPPPRPQGRPTPPATAGSRPKSTESQEKRLLSGKNRLRGRKQAFCREIIVVRHNCLWRVIGTAQERRMFDKNVNLIGPLPTTWCDSLWCIAVSAPVTIPIHKDVVFSTIQ